MSGPVLSANMCQTLPVILNQGNFATWGHLTMSGDILDFHHLGVRTGLSWGEAKDADPTMHKAALPPPNKGLSDPKCQSQD